MHNDMCVHHDYDSLVFILIGVVFHVIDIIIFLLDILCVQ